MRTPADSMLRAVRLGIDTHQEPVVYMRHDCHVCRAEGFEAQSRILVRTGECEVIATLNVVRNHLLEPGEAGLSESAWRRLGAREGELVALSHPRPLDSLSHVRAKIYGARLEAGPMRAIVGDIAAGRYADVHLAAFITACGGDRMDLGEIVALTRAMVDVGERLAWPTTPVVDKHCVGGLPGNRTTLLIVPIVTALGLTMPKTSSRAITSPAGSADTMETLAPVDLDLSAMRRVVESTGGCIVWGGAVHLSPTDDTLIRVERALDLDSEGQLVASVLSKKSAVGSTHVLLDLPVGPTAKVRSAAAGERLAGILVEVGSRLGLSIEAMLTDGGQPVGRGIGPALEARDVLSILRVESGGPEDLRERSLRLAGRLLEMGGRAGPGEGEPLAREVLEDGRAWRQFQRICEAQGGMREPPVAPHRHEVASTRAGLVRAIDNRRLARVAKLAGAPQSPAAGLELFVRVGARVDRGQPLYAIHAEAPGELAYALEYLAGHPAPIELAES